MNQLIVGAALSLAALVISLFAMMCLQPVLSAGGA
jgi:hypothetical protein